VTEFELIADVFAPIGAAEPHGVVLGIGDDGAIVAPTPGRELVVVTDTQVAGRHFPEAFDAADIGYRSLVVNVSDLAAMGAAPRWCQLALTLPELDPAWVRGFAGGFAEAARAYGIVLVGGDVTRGPLATTVTALGEVETGTALTRAGARPGDDVYVSGTLGEAALALALRDDSVKDVPDSVVRRAEQRLARPPARVALGRALRTVASSAIDVSDGLAQDLGHVAARSKVAVIVETAGLPTLPIASPDPVRLALAGGDDYELAFTAPPAARAAVAEAARAAAVAISRVGRIEAGQGVTLVGPDGPLDATAYSGFAHF